MTNEPSPFTCPLGIKPQELEHRLTNLEKAVKDTGTDIREAQKASARAMEEMVKLQRSQNGRVADHLLEHAKKEAAKMAREQLLKLQWSVVVAAGGAGFVVAQVVGRFL